MKRCPRCHRTYTDETLKFCRDDGAPLTSAPPTAGSPETLILSPPRRAEVPTQLFEETPSIAVLPFVNISADPENEFFCDGLAEELLNALTKVEGLKVAARTSSFSFKDKNAQASEIGRTLNVKTILEGSVRKSGNRLRIAIQLVNSADGYHLWSERYDRELKDIFDVQDDITLAVVDALAVKLLGKEKAAVLKRYTDNVEAYQLYLRGRFFWNRRTPEGFKKAIQYFEQAIDFDSNYALAYSGLADCYSILVFYEIASPREVHLRAKAAAVKAVELDGSLAESHISLGTYKYMFEWDWQGCEK